MCGLPTTNVVHCCVFIAIVIVIVVVILVGGVVVVVAAAAVVVVLWSVRCLCFYVQCFGGLHGNAFWTKQQ